MRKAFDVVANVAVIVLCVIGVYTLLAKPARAGRAAPVPPKEVVSLDGAEVQGSADAKAALVVFSDFECPFCGKFAIEILPTLEEKYVKTGKVKLAFRNFPLENIHKQAFPAAKAATCAADQGKFWAAHDGLFADQAALKGDWQPTFAAKYGLDATQYAACLTNPATEARIKADAALAKRYDLTGTPAIFVGSVVAGGVKVATVIPGAESVENISKAIDGVLK